MSKTISAALVALMLFSAVAFASPDSARLDRAKDFIADEQWARAIAELRSAMTDAKEKAKDEALYWLAHSLNQSGDTAAALSTIRRLEREYPSSLWVKPAGSLRLDIAVHLQRNDVLWWTAVAPPPPTPPAPPAPAVAPVPRARPRTGRPGYAPPAPPPPPASAAEPPAPPAPLAPPPPPPPPAAWLPEFYRPDTDLRIQALGSLIRTDAQRVIPMLKEIALDSAEPGEARRALFVLAQSGRPDAQETVVQVAKSGSESVRVAAVRELGRFGGPEMANQLLQVYTGSNAPVKRQVVSSLGERSERTALLRIAETEKDPQLKASAIVTLGRAGGGEQLGQLYRRAVPAAKRPIIAGLFNARADTALIRIAETEKDPKLRDEAIGRLRLLDTPTARAYLQKTEGIR